MKSIIRAASLLAAFLTPAFALAAYLGTSYSTGNVGDISTVADNIVYIINSVLVPLIFAIAFIVFLYGVTKTYILSTGDTAGIDEGHKLILWGIIGFVVMVSIWGLVNVVANTFGLAGSYAPPHPTSY